MSEIKEGNLAEIKDLSVSFMTDAGSIKAIDKISFEIPRKKVIGVVGGSIGEKLYEAKIYLQTGDLLAWTAVIVALSALFERAVLALLRRGCRWVKGGRT